MSAEPMRKCFVCGEWTQLPHADYFCERCYAQPYKLRGAIEQIVLQLNTTHESESDADIIAKPFEWRAEELLSRAFGGMHHVYNLHKSAREWHVNHYGDLSTFDFNALTLLVLGAHKYCIRVSIQPSGPGMVKICLWPRKTREGHFCDRHPTIKEAIVRYRDRPCSQSERQCAAACADVA